MNSGSSPVPVAAYCRVSTDRGDQANSFASQKRFFREYIARQPDFTLCEIYADEGISGTSTRKRTAFHRMMHDARAGRFQLLLTKEVSRFSRNILDTVAYSRELHALGIGIVFLNDGIDTRQPDAELRLSILGSIAQEESRRISQRVKWGQTRRMEQGVVFGRSMLGYDVKNGIMTVNPEGAAVVRLIFQKYGLEGKGTAQICRELQAEGHCTFRGSAEWSPGHVMKILKNEKYIGDLVQKKTVTPDYLTHEKKYNHGQEPLVRICAHHEPIIDRALWELVQARRKARGSSRYPLSGKILCGECGSRFVAKKRKSGLYWVCGAAARQGKAGCGIGKTLHDTLAVRLAAEAKAAAQCPLAELCSITVFADRHAEVRLSHTPQVWRYPI